MIKYVFKLDKQNNNVEYYDIDENYQIISDTNLDKQELYAPFPLNLIIIAKQPNFNVTPKFNKFDLYLILFRLYLEKYYRGSDTISKFMFSKINKLYGNRKHYIYNIKISDWIKLIGNICQKKQP